MSNRLFLDTGVALIEVTGGKLYKKSKPSTYTNGYYKNCMIEKTNGGDFCLQEYEFAEEVYDEIYDIIINQDRNVVVPVKDLIYGVEGQFANSLLEKIYLRTIPEIYNQYPMFEDNKYVSRKIRTFRFLKENNLHIIQWFMKTKHQGFSNEGVGVYIPEPYPNNPGKCLAEFPYMAYMNRNPEERAKRHGEAIKWCYEYTKNCQKEFIALCNELLKTIKEQPDNLRSVFNIRGTNRVLTTMNNDLYSIGEDSENTMYICKNDEIIKEKIIYTIEMKKYFYDLYDYGKKILNEKEKE